MKRTLATVLALLMILSTASFAAPTLTGTVTTASEAAPEKVQADIPEASLSAEKETYNDTYGTLVYEIDFETDTDFPTTNNAAHKLTQQGFANPIFEGYADWQVMVGGASKISKETDANGNRYVKFTNNATTKYPQLKVHSGKTSNKASMFVGENGYFTFMADVRYKMTSTDVNFQSFQFAPCYKYIDADNNPQVRQEVASLSPEEKTEWTTFTALLNKTKYTKDGIEYPYYGINYVIYPFYMTAACPTVDANYFEIDNVKMYYKPYSVDVTVLGGSSDTTVTVNISDDLVSTITKEKLMELAEANGCVGLTDLTLADGSSFESIDVVLVNTVKGVFKTYETYNEAYGTLLYYIDFEDSPAFASKQLLSQHGYVNTSFEGNEKWSIQAAGHSSATITTENGNAFLRVVTKKDAQNPQVNTYSGDVFTRENGFFTVMADVRAVKYTDTDAYKFGGVFFQPAYEDANGTLKSFRAGSTALPSSLSSTVFTTVTGMAKKTDTQSYKSIDNVLHVFGHNAKSPEGGNTFDIDNIKLYYKPFETTITILGDEKLSIPERNVAVQLSDASYVITKNELLKQVTTDSDIIIRDFTLADGTPFETVDLDKVTTLKAVYERVEWTHDTYGTLLYNLDFETNNDVVGLKSGSWLTQDVIEQGYVNHEFEGAAGWFIQPGAVETYEKVFGENNNYIKMTNKLVSYPQFKVYGGASGATFTDKDGYYTIVADVMINTSGNAGANINYFNTRYYYRCYDESGTAQETLYDASSADNLKPENKSGSLKNGEWGTYTTTRGDKSTDALTFGGPKHFLHIFWYDKNPTVAGKDELCLDNVKLYYKPFSADLTILGGENTAFGDKILTFTINKDLDSTVTKSELMALVENDTDMILSDLVLADGSAFEIIDVAQVSQVKAVWLTRAPESYNVASIRTNDPAGIRFRASVITEQKKIASEYGFIVTLEEKLGNIAASDFTHESNITKVTGVSYGYDPNTEKNVDRIYEIDGNKIFFTAALYGMPNEDASYRKNIIVRPYLKDTDGTYYYGTPVVRSVLDVAIAIRDGGYEKVDEYGKQYVQDILTVCGEEI